MSCRSLSGFFVPDRQFRLAAFHHRGFSRYGWFSDGISSRAGLGRCRPSERRGGGERRR